MKIHHRVLVKDLLLTLTLKEIHIILHIPGAGYVSNSDPSGSLYVEGALLNPVFKLAGNAVSNVARGLTKYSS